ncbi:MAG: integrin alpha [Proteobacteria bacterium]|nr:integrin alpha [Pseudomonadota bacterium]
MRVMGIAAAAAALSLGSWGCGDPLLCKSDVFVAVQTTNITQDLDPAPGVQGDLRVRTSLASGELVELVILDGDGHVTSTATAAVDGLGEANVRVTVPTPRATVRATATSTCGEGRDEVTFDVLAGTGCELAIVPVPATNEFYAPLAVLTSAQATLTVATRADWAVDVYATSAAGDERVGTGAAPGGTASITTTLHEGQVALRAVCHDPGATTTLTSTVLPLFVDSIAPACDVTAPAPGSMITPGVDADHDLSNGLQLAVEVAAIGADVESEPFEVSTTVGGSPVVATGTLAGDGTGVATITLPATSGVSYDVRLATQDHALNPCEVTHAYTVVLDGCDLAITAPTTPVTIDADGNAANGAQVDVGVTVGAACVGRTVTSTCGSNSPSGVVPAGGALTLRATVCTSSPCEATTPCTVAVTTASGVPTTAATTITFDNLAPAVDVAIVAPALACGSPVSVANDADPVLDGVQVVARVTAPAAVTRQLAVTNASGSSILAASTDVMVTLAPGINSFIGRGTDALGNLGVSPACTLTLSNLTVSFAAPAADGLVNEHDGIVSGTDLTFPLCGTVSTSGAAVTVAIDGGAAQPATVTGTSWCRTITVAQAPPDHTIVVNAVAGASAGVASLVLAVDVVDPPAITDFVAGSPDRTRIDATWTAPSGVDHYVARLSTTALTDANFDTTGSVLATTAPAEPGTAEALAIAPADTGTPVWLGIATFDAAGNRAVAAIVGPITPSFDQTGAIGGPNATLGALGFGSAVAYGRFDDDAYDDLAVAAPTQTTAGSNAGAVYVYLGGPHGLAASPALTIRGTAPNQRVGSSLATVRWSAAGDDLVIGVPGTAGTSTSAGRVVVFSHAALGAGAKTIDDASFAITVAATPGWYAAGNLGAALVATDLDGDGRDDLVASSPAGGGGVGGVTMIYGPLAASVALSDVDATGLGGATVALLVDPTATANHQFGTILHAVGDDLIISTADNTTTAGDSVFVARGDGTQPAPGFSLRPFTVGRDVRIDLVTTATATNWGSQVGSIPDRTGDGVRELVIAAPYINTFGRVLIVDGATLGTAGVARTTDAGVVLATINGASGVSRLGAAIGTFDARSNPDVDGDGIEDLVLGGVQGGVGRLWVWFGDAPPVGTTTTATSPYMITGPSTFIFGIRTGVIGSATWIGDVNGDGLDDLCWSSPRDNAGDGGIEILSDDRP